MSFLPDNYETPAERSNYMKFADGDNQFRVLSSAIVGWQYWTEVAGKRTPNRVRTWDELPKDVQREQDSQKRAKHFWAFVVLNRGTDEVQILEVTQKKVMKGIEGLAASKSWGDPKNFDLVVTRTKTGNEARDVEYTVRPEPKEALDEGIQVLYETMGIELEKLFDGEDPFNAQ